MSAAALAEIAATLGPAAVLHERQDTARYTTGTRYGEGTALAVLRPVDSSQVQEIVRWANRHCLKLIPQGANTGLVAASSPDETGSQVILSLERLKSVLELDAMNRTVRVGAGVLLHTLNRQLAEHGLCLPIDLGANPSIGGMIAANTGGARLLRYGDVRRHVLGLEVILADAAATRLDLLRSLRKDNSGVDLKQLFIGTGGAFGIITEAILEVRSEPVQRATALLIPAPDAAIELLRRAEAQFADMLCSFEGMSRAALECALKHRPTLKNPFPQGELPPLVILLELASSLPLSSGVDLELLLNNFLESLLTADEPLLQDALLGKAEDSWALRHAISDSLREEGWVVAFDIAVPRSQFSAFYQRARQLLTAQWPQFKLCDFGHLGDGGLHLNLVWPFAAGPKPPATTIEALRSGIYDIVVHEFGGSFSAEHGIGPYNQSFYERYTSPPARAVSGALQQLFDPDGRLSTLRFR
jgi:FAD/FMN-containing dehydrogenase